ncbi:hypothetical protein X975_13159, partial [Stegodyphus mimosarum]
MVEDWRVVIGVGYLNGQNSFRKLSSIISSYSDLMNILSFSIQRLAEIKSSSQRIQTEFVVLFFINKGIS